MDPRFQLAVMLTDKIFTILQHINEVKTMTKEEALRDIARERILKDSLVEEVTL